MVRSRYRDYVVVEVVGVVVLGVVLDCCHRPRSPSWHLAAAAGGGEQYW